MTVAHALLLQVAPAEPPPVVGPAAQLMFLAFLVVLLVVPWLMARGRSTGEATGTPSGEAAPFASRWFTSPAERRLWRWTVVVLLEMCGRDWSSDVCSSDLSPAFSAP